MWKKDEQAIETRPLDADRVQPDKPATTPIQVRSEPASIGRSITVRGDVTGDEDLLIQGRVEGSIDLQQHAVTVGAEGEVSASISGRIVTIEGRVEGDIKAEEQAILRSSAYVRGDITAPRVVLENGARFRGGVDMGDVEDRGKRSALSTTARSIKVMETGKPAGEAVITPPNATSSLIGKNGGHAAEASSGIQA